MSMTAMAGRTLTLGLAGMLLAVAVPSSAHAQGPVRLERSSFAPAASPVARRDQALSMRKMLRLLTSAQEQYFATHSAYTSNLDMLRAGFRAAWDDTVQVRILYAGARAWSGTATHPSLPGRSCVIFVGQATELPGLPRTAASGRVPDEEGVPVCDEG